ncbi:sensor histidine kinase [Pelagibius marinus]|uniref:sensor histidine kinase n=1 Tax=Pelagibius marinus TaxID=2762760 RepID=UPI001D03614B|nr:ATP-binding protein [Pelagibius marinus]
MNDLMGARIGGQRRGTARRYWGAVALAGLLVAALPLFLVSRSYFETLELQRAQSRVSLYRSTLVNALERYQHLPFVLAHDPFVIAAAEGRGREALNRRLAAFAAEARLDAIYLMDTTGLTVAASNHDQPLTFLGQNYSFRPYFRAALAGGRGQFFGIGATTSRPGFFIAEPVRGAGDAVIGVVALKLDLSDLETAWAEGGEAVFVSNGDGIVLLSYDPSIRYRTLEPVTESRRAEIQARRQFGREPLAPLDWTAAARDHAELDGRSYLHVTARIPMPEWTLHYLSDARPVQVRAWLAVIAAAIVAMLLLAIGLYLRARRIRLALAESQAARRKLQAANTELAREIDERREAERRLQDARSELDRASRLAALGQLAASVTHELGQPISAMKTYLTAAELDVADADTGETLRRLSAIVARMERLTQQLRFFARPGGEGLSPVDLSEVWKEAQALIGPDANAVGVSIREAIPEHPVVVRGDRLRLEQVMVNLCRNAILAMSGAPRRELTVAIEAADGKAILAVRDTGTGLKGETVERLQEPFVTSRASGEGMGLGLAISAEIVKEHAGRLAARDLEGAGAEFTVTLPLDTTARAA